LACATQTDGNISDILFDRRYSTNPLCGSGDEPAFGEQAYRLRNGSQHATLPRDRRFPMQKASRYPDLEASCAGRAPSSIIAYMFCSMTQPLADSFAQVIGTTNERELVANPPKQIWMPLRVSHRASSKVRVGQSRGSSEHRTPFG
jgi:hypothetical protein